MAVIACPNCGAPVIAGAIYCDRCDYDLRSPEIVKPVSSAPAPARGTGISTGQCPVCQHINREDAVFCENCGARLTGNAPPRVISQPTPNEALLPSAPLPVYQPEISPNPPVPTPHVLTSCLVVQSTNTNLVFPQGITEIIVGREDAISGVYPEINLEPFGAQEAGVSRRHLRMQYTGKDWIVEDLNTVNGTYLNRQRLAPGQSAALKDGDELRLGKLALLFHTD